MSGIFPSIYKTAIVKSLLKKPSLDQNNLKSYCPVSNLSFISKIIEKIVLSQISDYLSKNYLLSHTQSTHQPKHSTEAVQLKVKNDLLLALDRVEVSILTCVDLSAAVALSARVKLWF